jgi:hypothetical protein
VPPIRNETIQTLHSDGDLAGGTLRMHRRLFHPLTKALKEIVFRVRVFMRAFVTHAFILFEHRSLQRDELHTELPTSFALGVRMTPDAHPGLQLHALWRCMQ